MNLLCFSASFLFSIENLTGSILSITVGLQIDLLLKRNTIAIVSVKYLMLPIMPYSIDKTYVPEFVEDSFRYLSETN